MDWQPIETVRKPCLAIVFARIAADKDIFGTFIAATDEGLDYWHIWDVDGSHTYKIYPTHWMPLPFPPTSKEG